MKPRHYYQSDGDPDELELNGDLYVKLEDVEVVHGIDISNLINVVAGLAEWSRRWPEPMGEGSIHRRGEEARDELRAIENLAKKLFP